MRSRRRLEVGSESGPDRSKSIKSFLMLLFEAAGNCCVEVGALPALPQPEPW